MGYYLNVLSHLAEEGFNNVCFCRTIRINKDFFYSEETCECQPIVHFLVVTASMAFIHLILHVKSVLYRVPYPLQAAARWPSSLIFSVWSVISTVGYSRSAFSPAPRLLARPVVWYHPKVSDAFGCRARVACPAVALCLGFCFMLRLAAISTELWLFLEATSVIEYLLMFQCDLAHSSAFQLASALNDSAQEPLCTSLIDFHYQLQLVKMVKPGSDV